MLQNQNRPAALSCQSAARPPTRQMAACTIATVATLHQIDETVIARWEANLNLGGCVSRTEAVPLASKIANSERFPESVWP